MFYEELPHPLTALQQGDVLRNVPFAYFNLRTAVLSGQHDAVDLTTNDYTGSDVAVQLQYGFGIIISQTCDVQPLSNDPDAPSRKTIVLARAKPIGDVIKGFTEAKSLDAIKRLKNPGEQPTGFYLPSTSVGDLQIPRLVVDLTDVQRFGAQNLAAVKSMACLRLRHRCVTGFARAVRLLFWAFRCA